MSGKKIAFEIGDEAYFKEIAKEKERLALIDAAEHGYCATCGALCENVKARVQRGSEDITEKSPPIFVIACSRDSEHDIEAGKHCTECSKADCQICTITMFNETATAFTITNPIFRMFKSNPTIGGNP